MAVKYSQAVIFETMPKLSIKHIGYVMLISLTFLSFGAYVVLGNFKFRTENVNNGVSEENTEPGKETSKELTNSYLFEKTISLTAFSFSSNNNFHFLELKIPFISLKPNSPPPDLFDI